MQAEAVIFDMDGLLVDTEWMWRKVEVNVFKTVGLELTETMCRQTMGLNVRQVVEHWYDKTGWDKTVKSKQQVADDIVANMIEMIKNEVQPLDGVCDLLNYLKSGNNVKTAIASASSKKLIDAVTETLEISHYFDLIHSAEFGTYSKPHPEVFLTTAERLGVSPLKCVVLEDSIMGVIAAKAARMRCIAVPEAVDFNHPGYGIADVKLNSLTELTPDMLRL
jgi:HAD superfamily hydrolase (TIGR01509 family)